MERTSIGLDKKTKKRLEKCGDTGQSFDEVINDLIDYREQIKKMDSND
jgi:hypothetical protein